MDEGITVKSYWGVNMENRVIKQNSDVLAVLLPGIGYSLDRPLMDYSKKLVLQLGYDVLPIEYGFQISRKELNREKELSYVIKESIDIFKLAMNDNYKKIVIISKSIGTIVHSTLYKELKIYKTKNIYLTPINETLKVGIIEDSLVISGTSDPLINKETKAKIKEIKGINLLEINNGDHSLNIKDDVLNSIKVIHKVIEAEEEYLIK